MVAELLTAGGLILTVLLAYMRIQKQHESSLRLQEEHLKNALKVQVYHEVASQLHKTATALNRATSEHRSACAALRSNQQSALVGRTPTSAQLWESHNNASRSIGDLLVLLEKYEIVFLRFTSIQRQFGDENRRLRDASWELSGKLMMYLPMGGLPAESKSLFPLSASPGDLESIEALLARYLSVLDDCQGYILDAQVEAQNELLGNLFDRTVPPRNPADPGVKVLKRDTERRMQRPKGRWV